MVDDETSWAGGHGRPPYANRFQKGTSGNPAGRKARPRRVQAIGECALEHLHKPVQATVGGKAMPLSMLDAIIMRGYTLMLKTDKPREVTRFLEYLAKAGFNFNYEEAAARIDEREGYEKALDEKDRALQACHAELRQMARAFAALKRERGGGEVPLE